MKLYILKLGEHTTAWTPWYDKCFGMTIRAKDEDTARRLANSSGGPENNDGIAPWLDPKQSTCTVINGKGTEEVLLKDEHWA